MVPRLRTRARTLFARIRTRVDAIPMVGRIVEEWRRVEVVDRAMVTARRGCWPWCRSSSSWSPTCRPT